MSSAPHPSRPYPRPAFPSLQSSTGSSHSSSYSSTSSLAAPSPASSAPLPSPSSTQPQHQGFFSSLNPQQQRQQQQTQQQPQVSQMQPGFSYQPNRDGAGCTAAETTNYLNQAALLAEAAKRAQMAVVMRDIEGMEL